MRSRPSSNKARAACCALLAVASASPSAGFTAVTSGAEESIARLRIARRDGAGEEFLAGFYIYPYAVRQTAARLNVDYQSYLDGWMKQLTQKGFNLFYVTSDGTLENWLRLSGKYDFKLIVQLDFAYLTAGTRLTNDRISAAIAFIRKYKDHPNVLAFSVKEEPDAAEMASLDEYFDRIAAAVPDAPLHLLKNQHATLGYPLRHSPLIAATDRYAFWGWDPSAGGYSATPASALDWFRREIESFANAARGESPFFQAVFTTVVNVSVTSEATARAGSFGSFDRISQLAHAGSQGWLQLDNGLLRYIKYYRPPPNCTRAMVWLAVFGGARSILHWSGDPTDSVQEAILARELYLPGSRVSRSDGIDAAADLRRGDFTMQMMGRENKGSYMLDEYADAAAELQNYGWIINRMSPDSDQDFAHADRRNALVRVFDLPGFHGKILLIVNTEVGEWNSHSVHSLIGRDEFFPIDDLGNLVGFVPQTEPQGLAVRIPSGWNLAKLSDAKSLGRDERINIQPGGGAFLFAGDTAELDRLRQSTGLAAASGVRH